MKAKILVVEDERAALHALSLLLEDEGYEVLRAERGEEGLRLALREEPEVILLDVRLPDLDGLSVLAKLREGYSDSKVIVMTAETSARNAIQATNLGAFDYVAKPLDDEHLLLLIRRALEYRELEMQVRSLRQRSVASGPGISGMVGHSLPMQEVYKLIGRVAASDATVVIGGDSGTGKELVAQAIHEFSDRAEQSLVKVNCAAIPENLIEAELFGHEKGAFTSAVTRRIGRFEQAHRGTLFLDEIAELPLALQAKLLRVIQERSFERLGSNAIIRSDFRLLVATAQDLEQAVQEGRFREDLYYRLHVVSIVLPPLRERKEDIPTLIQHFLTRLPQPPVLREEALSLLLSHSWPGNVRELENVIARAAAIAPGGVITADCIQLDTRRPVAVDAWTTQVPFQNGYKEVLRETEISMLRSALEAANGNKSEAARILKIHRRLLYDRIRELGID